jgi:hypothetical protein
MWLAMQPEQILHIRNSIDAAYCIMNLQILFKLAKDLLGGICSRIQIDLIALHFLMSFSRSSCKHFHAIQVLF